MCSQHHAHCPTITAGGGALSVPDRLPPIPPDHHSGRGTTTGQWLHNSSHHVSPLLSLWRGTQAVLTLRLLEAIIVRASQHVTAYLQISEDGTLSELATPILKCSVSEPAQQILENQLELLAQQTLLAKTSHDRMATEDKGEGEGPADLGPSTEEMYQRLEEVALILAMVELLPSLVLGGTMVEALGTYFPHIDTGRLVREWVKERKTLISSVTWSREATEMAQESRVASVIGSEDGKATGTIS